MSREYINPPSLMKPMGYTHVVASRGERTLYVAGQGAFDENWQLVGEGDLEVQAAKAYSNLILALEGAGSGPEDIVKSTIYVVGLTDEGMGLVGRGIVTALAGRKMTPPASTIVGVDRLGLAGMLVEIEAISVPD